MMNGPDDAPVKHPAWVEVTVTVPKPARDAVIGWFMDRGSAGVQEDYPGLFPAEGTGPVTSGDPREWAGEAPPNMTESVLLRAWLPPPVSTESAAAALESMLKQLEGQWPALRDAQRQVREIESIDWNAEWKSHWKPVEIGRGFLVCPSWEKPPATDRKVIFLDPGMAFGTGTHFTTASCIEAAEDWFDTVADRSGVSVLDVGTGSGILAIAALKLGARDAFGIDVDPDAARESIRNADANCVADRYVGTDRPLTGQEGMFQLVFANILAQTLVFLAPRIAATVMPGGCLIASGILREYEDEVTGTFLDLGFTVVSKRHDESWSTLTFRMDGPRESDCAPRRGNARQ
ncbi:MAG TPA: 50S ribosomal protein L11 methyltransferase [Myxococcota bacterium]|nr:50S ribosomal protein L11 methyltransferase [Myxococcota bacterium]HOD00110.1 50S ribosomal protein L11 methyltransferase [Myxococcota bacterium]HOH75680.1 50S ribosomal protein L11 methyltransferase [Myxococcota bacterium]